ncbi:CLUMA_CG011800, isoform A [Clunio marinus]|uniref:CLUMA_CG011800, isoform A n=1 Tax=Clunio marinus TaxID=568069 RepID=A0A1J1IE14_9DIPT|nr:CLUMA_CG011800, isoform A [Clunio marinus]
MTNGTMLRVNKKFLKHACEHSRVEENILSQKLTATGFQTRCYCNLEGNRNNESKRNKLPDSHKFGSNLFSIQSEMKNMRLIR